MALQRRGEVRIRAGDDADVLAVGSGVVVERRRVPQAVALTAAHHAELVVGGQRPLEDAKRGAVERRVDDRTRTLAPGIPGVERGGRRVGGEHAGQVVRDRHACENPASHRALEEVFEKRIAIHALAGQWVAIPRI